MANALFTNFGVTVDNFLNQDLQDYLLMLKYGNKEKVYFIDDLD